ncbi:hypothetical protein Cs7R123_13730 [Catellatospora sp. TT07R-123]|uniref:DUF4362 domain-containing protein n=1 Tax=Catellatospora sp. TT07R-123 TaxID=2733863 RepID=UPI001B034C56|nr:DUF4362 domain-containing protein [Catellatospora sp. TT07R-123]GHJ44031.1 hypothetical protein Cs7R123_13730 [Catellatospora sp. TT07R-123]
MRTARMLVLLGLLLAAGCAGRDTTTGATAVAGPSPSGLAAASCGDIRLAQSQAAPEQALKCLIDAATAHRAAELVITGPTTEGDPITWRYTSTTAGTVILVIDSRQDRWAGTSAKLTTQTCTGPVLRPGMIDFASCTDPVPTAP